MKKTSGKVVSLVLALALVVTSFSSTFAFASTKSVSGTVSGTDNDSIYLSNGASEHDSVADLQGTWINAALDTKDHQTVGDVHIAAISHASGDALTKWKIDDNDVATLTLKSTSTSKTGKEVLSILYEGTYSNDDGDDVTVKARKNFTVNVLEKDSIVIGNAYSSTDLEKRSGKDIETSTFAMTENSKQKIEVYSVGLASSGTDAKAVYAPVNVTTKDKGIAIADVDKLYNIEVTSGDVSFTQDPAASINTVAGTGTAGPINLTVGKSVTWDDTNSVDVGKGNAAVANVTITVRKLVKDDATTAKAGTSSDDKYTLKTKVEKKVDVEALNGYVAADEYKIDKSGSKTVLNSEKTGTIKDFTVTGAEVNFPAGTLKVTVDEGSVKEISGEAGVLEINDGTVSSVDVNNTTVEVSDGNVGDIHTDADASKLGTVTVTGGKAGNIDTTDVNDTDAGEVTINGGTVGTIDSDDAVVVEATDEETAVSTGKITAPDVTVFSSDAKTAVNGIKSSADGTITIKGDQASVGAMDFDYREVALNLGDDDDALTGTFATPVNATKATITTENEDTNVTFNSAADVDTISVGSDSDLKFTDTVKVDTVEGDGALTVAAGKLYVTGSVSGTTLKLSDANLAAGTTVLKADSDVLGTDDFNCFGFTLAKTSGSSVDTFKIASLSFAGLAIDKPATRIAKGYSETFTAVAYPGGTALPAGSTIEWSLDGSTDVFDVTTSGTTATVKVLTVDPDFASENTATLTATLKDADGYDLDDYATGSVQLTAISTPDAKSDTTTDVSVAKGASYTMKVTSTTAPTVTLGTGSVFAVAATHAAGSNDYFYKLTATGSVGAATGVYLNGTKIFVASVKAAGAAFTSDTTKDVKVTKGNSYTYKITSATTPSFGFGTGSVFTVSGITKSGNDYFFKITATGAAGKATGVYVNGVKVNVATVG